MVGNLDETEDETQIRRGSNLERSFSETTVVLIDRGANAYVLHENGEYVVGRDKDPDDKTKVVLKHDSFFSQESYDSVSRKHCRITLSDEGVFVSDGYFDEKGVYRTSKNHTFVNSKMIRANCELRHGDCLELGPSYKLGVFIGQINF